MYLSKLQKQILKLVKKNPGIRRRSLFIEMNKDIAIPRYAGRPKMATGVKKLPEREQKPYHSRQAAFTRSLVSLERKGLIRYTRGSMSQLWFRA